MELIPWSDDRFLLGVAQMDATHREFVALVNAAAGASGEAFKAALVVLFDHTRDHFAAEEALMEASGFFATEEHRAEHRRVLGDLHRFRDRLEQGSPHFARAWLRDTVPEWFRLHAATMDSALAFHLKKTLPEAAPQP